MARLKQVGSLAVVVLLAGRAAAEVTRSSASFSYTVPVAAGCSSEAALKAAIAGGLGYESSCQVARAIQIPRLLLTVAILRESATTPSLVAEITLSDRAGRLLGHQSIRSPSGDCRVLSSVTALAARLILEPEPRSTPVAQPRPNRSPATIAPERTAEHPAYSRAAAPSNPGVARPSGS